MPQVPDWIVSRAEWGSKAALGPAMKLPASECWLHHSVTPVTLDAAKDMRVIERVGIERFGRFSYSWALHPDGQCLEGAGFTVGAHTANHNSRAFGVVLIGNYQNDHPTKMQVDTFHRLRDWLIADGHLKPGVYPTGGHRDLKQTACPGQLAYDAMALFRATPSSKPQEDDMAVIIRHHVKPDGASTLEVTDWVQKHPIPTNAVVEELQKAGLKVVNVSDALADSIPAAK